MAALAGDATRQHGQGGSDSSSRGVGNGGTQGRAGNDGTQGDTGSGGKQGDTLYMRGVLESHYKKNLDLPISELFDSGATLHVTDPGVPTAVNVIVELVLLLALDSGRRRGR